MAHSIKIPTRGTGIDRGSGGAAQPRCLTLLTVQQAANYASVSTQTVRRWIKAGHFRVLRAGRQIRIDESDLLAYLCRQD